MIEYKELYKIVESKLTTERFAHTLRVVERAMEYAKIYKVDEKKAKLTALAHDIAKDLTAIEQIGYENILDEIEQKNSNLQHAKIGAMMCKQYGFTCDMLNAIKYHTTGHEEMTILEKIIYLADATESGRKIGKTYVELVNKDIDLATLEISVLTLNKLLTEKNIIHVDTIKCYNYYNILCQKKMVK